MYQVPEVRENLECPKNVQGTGNKASEARGVSKRDLAKEEGGERDSSKIMQNLKNQGKDLILGAMGEC